MWKDVLKSIAFIRFEGEGAQEKALELDGTDVGGWTAIVKAAQMPREYGDRSDGRIREWYRHCRTMVKGYDTRLPEIDIQIELCKVFSSCGEVIDVGFLPGLGAAAITIVGVRCEENAMALNESDEHLVVKSLNRPENKYLKKHWLYAPILALILELKKEKMEMEKKKKKNMEKEKALS